MRVNKTMSAHPAACGEARAGTKTALVLSAGGMFGSYQAGVWAALCSEFQPDIVVGASIGSLNGWLIASGVPAREIEDRWMNLEDAAEHRFQWPRRLSDGILRGERVETWIRDIFGSVQPTCE